MSAVRARHRPLAVKLSFGKVFKSFKQPLKFVLHYHLKGIPTEASESHRDEVIPTKYWHLTSNKLIQRWDSWVLDVC